MNVQNHISTEFRCEFCGTKSSSISNLNTHMLGVHTEDAVKKFECPLCGKKYARKCDSRTHLKIHSVQPKGSIKCMFCQIYFKTQERAKNMRRVTQKSSSSADIVAIEVKESIH